MYAIEFKASTRCNPAILREALICNALVAFRKGIYLPYFAVSEIDVWGRYEQDPGWPRCLLSVLPVHIDKIKLISILQRVLLYHL
jgi:hypothetical protein